MIPEYATCYEVLRIAPECSWQQLREHYRLLAKQWHPDHFRDDTDQTRQAEEKIKEINHAFYTLSQYYRQHGHLPRPMSSEWFVAANEPGTGPATDKATDPAPTQEQVARTTRRARNRSWRYIALALSALGVFGLTLIFKPTPRAAAIASPTRSPVPERPLPPATAPVYFTVGSTLGEVHTIQGTPSRVENDIWYYGNAKVWFRQGVVHRWEDDPLTPLKARAESAPLVRSTRFRVGSTMHEVRMIQGKPTHEGENVWDYGVSRVYFKGDRVAGWDNSPLNPLKIP